MPDMPMVRCLILGRQGQIARALTSLSWPAHWEVKCLGRAELDLTDITHLADRLAEEKPHLLINAAAYTAVDKAETEKEQADLLNHYAVAELGKFAAKAAIPLIHYSTDYVFDGSSNRPYIEEDPTKPLNVYGASKRRGEQALQEHYYQCAILRTSWVFHETGANFLLKMLSLADRPSLAIVDDQIGAPSYAYDLAVGTQRLAQAMLEKSGRFCDVFHFTAAGATSWYGFAQAIFTMASSYGVSSPRLEPIPSTAYPTPAKRPLNSQLNCQKIARDYGIILPEWRDGLQRCLAKIFREQE